MPIVQKGKQNKQLTISLDATLLDPALLQDEIVLENALCVLEGHLMNPAVNQGLLLRSLMEIQNLFEFVYSGISSKVASVVKAHIDGVFPLTAPAFENSLVSDLLEKLSQYFWHLDLPLSGLAEHHRSVQMIRPVLKALANLNLPLDPKSPTVEGVNDDLNPLPFTKRTKQRDWKKNKRAATQTLLLDTKLFAHLNVDPPTSAEDVTQLEMQLLNDLRDILMDYLDALRKPTLVPHFKVSYLERSEESTPSLGNANPASETEKVPDTGEALDHQSHAYPVVQPMKAALYFDSAEGLGDWHVIISSRASKDLRNTQRADKRRFGIYLKKIRELSNGHFSDDNQKRLAGSDKEIPIYEAKMTRDSRLVYQIDCIKEYGEETERQVIRIFGIYTHAQLERDWTYVTKYLSGKGKEYKRRCLYRTKPTNARDKVYAPATFPLTSEKDVPCSPMDLTDLRAEDKQDLHSLLVLEKYVTFSQALLNSILADQDVAHVFHMSPTEQEIVRHAGSCYVRGRSGTGKTTTMLFKMLGIEQARDSVRASHGGELPRPRQLFVTQSRVLAEKVQEYYTKLSMSQAAAYRTAEESTRLAAEQKDPEKQVLVDKDEEELHHSTLPKSFRELKEEHFPLFITYDQLCRLLEASNYEMDGVSDDISKLQNKIQPTEMLTIANSYIKQQRASFISYNTFLGDYWPHLPHHLTKGFDPALVFAEFMGIIKGSEESVDTEKGHIDQETYMNVTRRQLGTFTSQRDVVYWLFEEYTKMKQERAEWDAADRTHKLLQRICEGDILDSKVDFVYVDEVQDNLMIDALLMRKICKHPNGLFWAGDTAQTISAGSSFRFEALKAFMHRVEKKSSSAPLAKAPREFQLAANFRSHGGIVNAAHSIVKLITKFWPNAIDTLSEERAEVDGAKPVFFTGWDEDTVQYEQFLFGSSGNQIEFGANQCILVRDEAAKDELQKQVGDIGTVLTLYESKGLEFNDVLLYNFFEDSTVDVGQWRVILNALPNHNDIKCPIFDETRHSGVCRELKFLYVAITRARQNVWIADCSDKGEPLRMFWTAQGLVETMSAVGSVPQLASSSKLEEWAEMAKTLFANKRYSQASRAFERAKMPREKDIAGAYHLREAAQRTPRSQNTVLNPREQAFHAAAEAFFLCAGLSPSRKERLAYYRIAAECYLEASELKKAAEAYILTEDHTQAAQVFRQGGLFDEAIDTIDQYKEQIQPIEAEKIRDVAKIHYSKEQDLDRATKLFSDVDEALVFMDDFGFNVARVALLEQHGRLREAAEIHLAEGNTLDAIRFLMRDLSNKESRACLEDSLLKGVRGQLSFGIPLADELPRFRLEELLGFAREATAFGPFSSRTLDEFALCKAALDNNISELHNLKDRFLITHSDHGAVAMCLDYAFKTWLQLTEASADIIMSVLDSFSAYTRELRQLSWERNPLERTTLQRLFGYYPAPEAEHMAIIPSGTLLHGFLRNPESLYATRWIRPVLANDGGFMVSSSELSTLFGAAVRGYFLLKIQEENLACLQAPAFRLCPVFMALGERQNSKHRCSSSHNPKDMTSEALHRRFRMLLQQIHIYQWVSVLGETRKEFAKQRRRWISRLYEAYFPVHSKAGSALQLDLALIPEADKGFEIVKEWIRDLLYTQCFEYLGPWNFLTFIAEVATLALRFEKHNAFDYFRRAPCVTMDRPERYIRNGGRYIVWDLLDFLGRTSATSLSAGVCFIKHVCYEQLHIDANVLCHMIELLCAAYAVGHRLRIRGSLHDITLSRRLLARLYADKELRHQDHSALGLFIGLMPTLLREMYYGSSEFLRYEQTSRFDFQVRHIFVARICKSFTLLGYNINDPQLQSILLRNMASFKEDTEPGMNYDYPAMFRRYVHATSWDELVHAVRSTGAYEKGTPEELIQLRDAKRLHGPSYEVFGTRSVVYRTVEEIPALLWGNTIPGHSLPRNAPIPERSSESGRRNIQLDELEPSKEFVEKEEVDTLVIVEDQDAVVGHNDITELTESETGVHHEQHGAAGLTPEEIQIATRLALAYRSRLSHRQSAREKGQAEYNRIYQSYRESPMIEGMPRRYRLLFLGPLPLAFLCLRTMATHVANSKAQARARMSLVSHSEYERVGAQINRAIAIDRRIRHLRQQLDPKSEFHRKLSEPELKAHVQEIADIASEHPRTIDGVEWELRTAVKGIVQDPSPPKKPVTLPKPSKPELVTDFDDYELVY
ncbi:hypothetical protein BDY19DRAFT_992789 [Irpex rosettiformis]|uniref:Uncharacterized protein n=1 Tax=Irpex rosettiformis TaxID=378272 RepID=A0ACB8U6L1_9APHY|nr:hypothetical protein BDY19DRAFT_992789 [Irpex rosettiformis]